MSKLHFALTSDVVAITLYNGEKFSDEKKEIVEVVEFKVEDVPAELKDGDVWFEQIIAGSYFWDQRC